MILHFKDKIDYNETKIGQKYQVRRDNTRSLVSPHSVYVANSDLPYPELFTSKISFYDLFRPQNMPRNHFGEVPFETKRNSLKDARLICNVNFSDFDDVFPSDESEIKKTKQPWTGLEKNTAFFTYITQQDSMDLYNAPLDIFKTKYKDACNRFFAQMEILNDFYYNVICQENIAKCCRIKPNINEKIVVTLLFKDSTSYSIVEFLCDGIIYRRFHNVTLEQEGLCNQIPDSILKNILGDNYQTRGSETQEMFNALQKVLKDFEWKGFEATLNYPNDTVVKVIQLDDYPQKNSAGETLNYQNGEICVSVPRTIQRPSKPIQKTKPQQQLDNYPQQIPDFIRLTPEDLSGFKITDNSVKTISLNYTKTHKYPWRQDNMHDCWERVVKYVSYNIYIDFPLIDMKKRFMSIVDNIKPCNNSEQDISRKMNKISYMFGQDWERTSGEDKEEADITEISIL